MQSQLKKLEGSISGEHSRNLQLLKQQYVTLQNDMKKASEKITVKKTTITESITS